MDPWLEDLFDKGVCEDLFEEVTVQMKSEECGKNQLWKEQGAR